MQTTNVKCANCGKVNRLPAAASGTPRCANCHQPLSWIAVAGDDDFAEVIERSKVPVLVDLWATWCGPCRMVSPALEQLATERAGRLKLVKVDVDEDPALAAAYGHEVPVLCLGSRRVVSGRVSARALRALLARQPG